MAAERARCTIVMQFPAKWTATVGGRALRAAAGRVFFDLTLVSVRIVDALSS